MELLVEIFDIHTGTSSISNLFENGSWYSNEGQNAVLRNDKIVFFRHAWLDNRRFDIYDISTGQWSIGEVELDITFSSIISVNNVIYIAGGYLNGSMSVQVWKLEF